MATGREDAMVVEVVASMCGGVAAGCAAKAWCDRKARVRRRVAALGLQVDGAERPRTPADGRQWPLRYADGLTRRLFVGTTEPITPSVRAKRAGSTRAGTSYKERSVAAGCSKEITVSAYCEARTRLALAGAAAGALLGVLLSSELAVLLGVAGACLGHALPGLALRREIRDRAMVAELHLSEMLEVVALGLRSGMTFDRSFALYGAYFDNEFARSCLKAHRRWSLGLATREEALRDLAASYECEQLARVVDSIVRSLRFGSALAGILEEASAQSRASYRAKLEEKVAKAPVKMMLPTGTLILPAMLLMVVGPVLLELSQGF